MGDGLKAAAFLISALLPAALAAQSAPDDAPPTEATAPALPSERSELAQNAEPQPAPTAQSQPAVRPEPRQATSPQQVQERKPSQRELELERELEANVAKSRQMVTQLRRALAEAQSDEEKKKLRRELAGARNVLGTLENELEAAGDALDRTSGKLQQEAARNTALAGENASLAEDAEALELQSSKRARYIRYTALIGGILLAFGALIATYFLLRSKNRSKKLAKVLSQKENLERERAEADDWLLTGNAGRLKLRGMLLATEERGSIVGRGQAEADVIVNDQSNSISRRHARFFYRDTALYVEDLRSLNGTFHNGTRLNAGQIQKVSDGDELRFGKLIFRLLRA